MIFRKNYPLSKLTTFRIGGKAEYFAEVGDKKDLIEAASFAKEKNLPVFVIGEGSNVLVSDEKFDGLVVHFTNKDIKIQDGVVTSGAGVKWDYFVDYCVKKNLAGIECLSGIPGTVGAAPYQNIGAYGQELKDTFLKLEAFDLKLGKFVTLNKKQCAFGYRDSIFKKSEFKGRYIIFEVYLKLKKDGEPNLSYASLKSYLTENNINNPTLGEVRDAVVRIRSRKLDDPKVVGNAGSFFKNPVVGLSELKRIQEKYPEVPNYPAGDGKVKLFAGWIVDKAGWKGKKYGGVSVSEKNALVLINLSGKGKAREVAELAEKIVKGVYEKFKIKLEPEVQYINF